MPGYKMNDKVKIKRADTETISRKNDNIIRKLMREAFINCKVRVAGASAVGVNPRYSVQHKDDMEISAYVRRADVPINEFPHGRELFDVRREETEWQGIIVDVYNADIAGKAESFAGLYANFTHKEVTVIKWYRESGQ